MFLQVFFTDIVIAIILAIIASAFIGKKEHTFWENWTAYEYSDKLPNIVVHILYAIFIELASAAILKGIDIRKKYITPPGTPNPASIRI